ncbi:hypothetical protein BH20ACI2_BH20ACI2_20960 [soil metagenome]
MSSLVDSAREKLGSPSDGQCYCLKLPAIVGGKYKASNFGLISIRELIAFSGEMAAQTADLPTGGSIQFKITDDD